MSKIDQRDEMLANILKELTEASADQRPTLATLVNQHPELADDLRELWGTVMVVDALAARDDSSLIDPKRTVPLDAWPRGDAAPPRVLGDFELVQEIGRGGMGIVFCARQRSLNRRVAVKVLMRGADASTDDRARFQSEAEAAAQLAHPNIVPIYETGDVEGWRYIGMKLIEGETLSSRLSNGPLPQDEAAKLVLQAALAIQYAHDHGVVHRDLKPANILIDESGAPHISDFGLAKLDAGQNSLTTTGAILGTPSYMSPEQASGGRDNVGPPSDVYSLGAILYALLTGRPPFQATSPVETVLAVLEQDPLPPRLLNRGVARDLEMIILRCLQKPPELRYMSADGLADDLKAFLAGEPIVARSGKLSHVVARVFRDSHHATVLENWGLLWMWHAVLLFVLCGTTNLLANHQHQWHAWKSHWSYVALWGGGLAIWAPIFWAMRRRMGPVTAVERQIAHAWGGSIVAVVLLFVVEALLELDVLVLSPILGLIAGMVFVVKAGILTGTFYIHAGALFACGIAMAVMQRPGVNSPYGLTLFGVVSAAVFFIPGWKYHRQSKLREAGASARSS